MICFGMLNKWRMVLFSELARHSVKAGNTLLLSFVNWGNMFVKQQSKRKNYMDSCELSVFFFVLFFARGRKAKSNAMSNLHGWSILRIFYYLMLGLWKEQNISNKILIPPPFRKCFGTLSEACSGWALQPCSSHAIRVNGIMQLL